MFDAYDMGYEDFVPGIDVQNPFEPGTSEYFEWRNGYIDALNEFAQ